MNIGFQMQKALHNLRKRKGGPVVEAHTHGSRHGEEMARSAQAGCFYCCAVFSPSEISDWLDEAAGDLSGAVASESTALCPRCGIDSVIGDASGFPVTDPQFLKDMNRFWF
jgi:hypothetical protein